MESVNPMAAAGLFPRPNIRVATSLKQGCRVPPGKCPMNPQQNPGKTHKRDDYNHVQFSVGYDFQLPGCYEQWRSLFANKHRGLIPIAIKTNINRFIIHDF